MPAHTESIDEIAERIKDLEEEMVRLGKIPITESIDEIAERIKDLEEEMVRLGKIPITESIDERIKVIENMRETEASYTQTYHRKRAPWLWDIFRRVS